MPATGDRDASGLRHWRDWQSLAYLAALPTLAGWQWIDGFWWPAYAVMLFLTVGTGVIHHNHAHLRIWRGRHRNRITDFAITLLQGHPACAFWPTHIGNHHRHKHGEADLARTYRFGGGDTNNLAGYLLHPVQAAWVLYPRVLRWLAGLRRRSPGAFRYCMAQYAIWLTSWVLLLALDWQRALLFVIVPQLFGLHWLLAANYLQHAHADGRSGAFDYARNFGGLVNPLLFNIGYHTAHHEHPQLHWTKLPGLHQRNYLGHINPVLNEASLSHYVLRTFVLGAALPRFRSRSLMPPAGRRGGRGQ